MKHNDPWRASDHAEVWRLPAALVLSCFLGLTLGYIVVMTSPGEPLTVPEVLLSVVILAALFGVLYWVLVRARLILTPDQLVIVKWFRTQRIPLTEVMSAKAGYNGTTFWLSDGSTRDCGVLQAPNYTRWLGRRSRADKIAAHVVAQAALLRGESPTADDGDRIKRSSGNLAAGIWQAIIGAIGR